MFCNNVTDLRQIICIKMPFRELVGAGFFRARDSFLSLSLSLICIKTIHTPLDWRHFFLSVSFTFFLVCLFIASYLSWPLSHSRVAICTFSQAELIVATTRKKVKTKWTKLAPSANARETKTTTEQSSKKAWIYHRRIGFRLKVNIVPMHSI